MSVSLRHLTGWTLAGRKSLGWSPQNFAQVAGTGSVGDMNEDQTDRAAQRRTRIFLVIFVSAALLLSLTTILGTWSRMGEQAAVEPVAVTAPAAP
jgi:hypothetical protein